MSDAALHLIFLIWPTFSPSSKQVLAKYQFRNLEMLSQFALLQKDLE